MNILLIEPRLEHGITTYHKKHNPFSRINTNPSTTLPMIAAVTPPHHTIRIINENYEDVPITQDWDVVGISVLTMTAPRAYHLADQFRDKGATVILGGYHPSALPEEAQQHADSIIIGEAERSWPRLLKDIENNTLQPRYTSEKPNLESFPQPRTDLYYHSLAGATQATRGCPVGCEFCPTSWLLGKKVRKRPIKDVIQELQNIPNKLIIFRDASLTHNPTYAKKLFKAMKKLDKKWIANGNINILGKDEEFLRLAQESGCIQWFIGLESLSTETLANISKTTNIQAATQYGDYIHKIHQHGMAVFAGLIFGFDEDTPDVFDKTYKALQEWHIDIAEFNILTPYPGTRLYNRLEKENRITTKDWSKYTQAHVVYQPKNMIPDELREGYTWITKKFYTPNKIIKRALHHFKYTPKYSLTHLAIPSVNFALHGYYKRERQRIHNETQNS